MITTARNKFIQVHNEKVRKSFELQKTEIEKKDKKILDIQDKIENARKRREEEKKKKTKYNDFSLPNPNLTRQRATS